MLVSNNNFQTIAWSDLGTSAFLYVSTKQWNQSRMIQCKSIVATLMNEINRCYLCLKLHFKISFDSIFQNETLRKSLYLSSGILINNNKTKNVAFYFYILNKRVVMLYTTLLAYNREKIWHKQSPWNLHRNKCMLPQKMTYIIKVDLNSAYFISLSVCPLMHIHRKIGKVWSLLP